MNRHHESGERNEFQRDDRGPQIVDRPTRAIQNYVPSPHDIDDQFDNARSHGSDSEERAGRGRYTMNYGADHRSSAAGEPDYFGQQNYPGADRLDFRGKGPKNYMRSDARIREDINEKLTDAPWLDASDISVQVSGGKVLLEGSVSDRRLKHRVEDVVARCHGVNDIENRMTVSPARTPSNERVAGEDSTLSTHGEQKH